MTALFSSVTVSPDDGLVTMLHLSVEDAYEVLRTNFCDEVAVGDVAAIIETLSAQGILFEVTMHDVDLSDIRAEFPDGEQFYKTVYNVMDSHAFGATTVGHCVCGRWASTDGFSYDDHLTREVLAALHVPMPRPTT